MEEDLRRKHWRNLSNVFKGVVMFKQSETSQVNDIEELLENVRSSTSTIIEKKRSIGDTGKAIQEYRLSELVFTLIARGSQADLDQLEKLVLEDPKRYIRPSTDSTSLVNRPSPAGVRPIVEAARYGHCHIVQYLLDTGANPHLPSRAGPDEDENALEVACRWSHLEIVRLLLGGSKWTRQEIKFARKVTTNLAINRVLLEAMPKGRWWSCLSCR
jgi:hypothetical protein